MNSDPIVIIGAGPSGLMAAQKLAESGYKVVVFEQNKAAARKFLVAGHGGFNLTHDEQIEKFITRYDKKQLQDIVKNFDNKSAVEWLAESGIPTYVGSSGKIFPIKSIKPIQVLKAWLDRLEALGVKIFYEHVFTDFDSEYVTLQTTQQEKKIKYNKLILALGGKSWSKTGSDGKWIPLLQKKSINIIPLESANSGYNTIADFSELEGQVLKNIAVNYKNIFKKGELVFTKYGIEGSSIYYLNRFTRKDHFPITLFIDLKPNLEEYHLITELQKSKNVSKTLKEKIKMSASALYLLRKLSKESFTSAIELAHYIKNYPIEVTSLRPIEEVISTAGGVDFNDLKQSLSLRSFPKIYCIGEMVDWEAPTGGYLLQACFSMGVHVAKEIIKDNTNN